MSKDELEDLPPLEDNPLGGDLLQDLPPAESGDLLSTGDPLAIDEGEAIAAPSSASVEEPQPESPPEESRRKSPGIWARLAQSNPYNVMLFVSLVALLIGIACLLLEWGSYNFEIKPT